jgi:hypothetical protein
MLNKNATSNIQKHRGLLPRKFGNAQIVVLKKKKIQIPLIAFVFKSSTNLLVSKWCLGLWAK